MTRPGRVVRVVVVDDDAGIRGLIRLTLEDTGRFEVVGTAGDGDGALRLAAEEQPDVAIVDLGLPDVLGVDLIPRIHELAPAAHIVIFTGADIPTDQQLARLPEGTRVVVKGDIQRLLAALEGDGDTSEVGATFDPEDESAPKARRFVGSALENWGLGALEYDTSLIVSELVTNALLHAGSAVRVTLKRSQQLLRVEVWDGSLDRVPDPKAPVELEEHGRGLMLVSALSRAWGIEPAADGKVVWAEVAVGAA
jgi:CheY-like chemotaxis protein